MFFGFFLLLFFLFSNVLVSNSASQEISWHLSSSGLNRSLRISLQSEEMFSLDLRSEREREREGERHAEGGREEEGERKEGGGRGTVYEMRWGWGFKKIPQI